MANYECKRCGAFLMQSKEEYCDVCTDKNHKDLALIRDMIYETNENDLASISQKTGISIKIINMLASSNHIVFHTKV